MAEGGGHLTCKMTKEDSILASYMVSQPSTPVFPRSECRVGLTSEHHQIQSKIQKQEEKKNRIHV